MDYLPFYFLFFACFILPLADFNKKNSDLVIKLDDVKEIKKILRTRTNVLIIFVKQDSNYSPHSKLFRDVAEKMRGVATIILVNCGPVKKVCKKFKATPTSIDIKHYKDGDFNKDYDRKLTPKSMVSFLRDPTGDIPWSEDSTADDVVHLENGKDLSTFLGKERRPTLIMFYAPWCGFCKKLKPDYALAATELKGEAVLVGMDVDRPEAMQVRVQFNITGFPTIYYFESGKMKYKYGGENNKAGIIEWMKNPSPPKDPVEEKSWADVESDVVHLTEADFDDYITQHSSVLVMFYAPWCGHCKNMKPEYQNAATQLKQDGIDGILAAIDATQEKKLADRFKIQGFPSVKYFKDGAEAFDFNERTADKIVEFMKDPKEPPAPQAPEPAWNEVESDVVHLTDDTFKSVLKKRKHTLVMFYAPWCGHCKKAKPEFMEAAAMFDEDNKVSFAAIDCTSHSAACQKYEVSGYPTFIYFNYGKNEQKYTGGREKADFVNFMKDPLNPQTSQPPATQQDDDWESQHILHLTQDNFDSVINTNPSVLVMFYAPWCGHCKSMKPDYAKAASRLKSDGIVGVIAALDATVHTALADKFKIPGFPTIKYFKGGKFVQDYSGERNSDNIVEFMKSSQPAKPSEEAHWKDASSRVMHLTMSNMGRLASFKTALVMFYTNSDNGLSKTAMSDFSQAADSLNDSSKKFAAVDCAVETEICSKYEISRYPFFKFFRNGKLGKEYDGGQTTKDFISAINLPEKKDEL